jgi:hypothetical protein
LGPLEDRPGHGRDVGRAAEIPDLAAGRLGLDVVDVDADREGVGIVDLELLLQGFEEQVEAPADLGGRAADEPGLVLVDGGDERDLVDGLEGEGPFDPLTLGHGGQMNTLPKV